MYYQVTMGKTDEIEFRPDRLKLMMQKRKLTPGQLQYMTGISQPQISLLMNGKRPEVSAVIVAKLADALGCSADYLLGLTDDYAPNPMALNEALDDLFVVARKLPSYRQEDLRSQAIMYLNKNESEDAHLMNVLLDKINEVGGDEAEELILKLLQSFRPPGDSLGTSPTLPT